MPTPAEQAYASYVRFCERVGIPPLAQDDYERHAARISALGLPTSDTFSAKRTVIND